MIRILVYGTLLLLLFLIAGCQTLNPSNPTVVTDKINVCGNPPKADPVIMRAVEPIVIQDKFKIHWIGITPRHYENLSINLQSMLSHIKQQKQIIEYYKKCINTNTK